MAVSEVIDPIGKTMEGEIADFVALLEGGLGRILQCAKGCVLSHHQGHDPDHVVTLHGTEGITAVANLQGMSVMNHFESVQFCYLCKPLICDFLFQ